MPKIPIYYDTETTGTKPEKDRVIEIAAYDPIHKREFVSFINPGIPIPKEATDIHHITNDMVKDAPDFGIVGKHFIEFCGPDAVLVAHNNDAFDILFLKAEFFRFDIEMPQWQFVDTLKWSRKYRRDLPRHSLQFLREIFGIPENQAHRALDDVKVLYEVFSAMIDDLSIEQVYSLLNQTSNTVENITHMPFGKHQGTPLDAVPKDYLNWLSGSGALDKPENASLKNSLIIRGLISNKPIVKEPSLIGIS